MRTSLITGALFAEKPPSPPGLARNSFHCKRDGICGSGYCVYAIDEWSDIDIGRWVNVLDVSFSIGPLSVTVAETLAILESVKSIQQLVVRRNVFFNSQARVKPMSLLE